MNAEMQCGPVISRTFTGPTRIAVEASHSAIVDLDLDTWAGEQFDLLNGVVSVAVDARWVIIEKARTLEALKRGEPNAGRGTLMIPRRFVKAIWTAEQ